jgi:hypothetical protein
MRAKPKEKFEKTAYQLSHPLSGHSSSASSDIKNSTVFKKNYF